MHLKQGRVQTYTEKMPNSLTKLQESAKLEGFLKWHLIFTLPTIAKAVVDLRAVDGTTVVTSKVVTLMKINFEATGPHCRVGLAGKSSRTV